MESSQVEVRDVLLRECEEFQQLSKRHHELEQRLAALMEKMFLTEEEKLEAITLKKKKLLLKDRMAHLIRSH